MLKPEESVEFYESVLPREVIRIVRRRNSAKIFPCGPGKPKIERRPWDTKPDAVEKKSQQCAYAHKLRSFGLALSGGGIRSATFNLGVLQGLAERGLLPYIDYLSSVSGGGYIASWLHGVVNSKNGDIHAAAEFLSPTQQPIPGIPEDDPITFLRKFSNYLAARPGLFSSDVWVIGSIWLRNVLLNQLVLLPAIAALVLAAFLAGFAEQPSFLSFLNPWSCIVAAVVLFYVLVYRMTPQLGNIAARSFHPEIKGETEETGTLFPYLAFSAGLVLTFWSGKEVPPLIPLWLILALLFFWFQLFGGFWTCFLEQHEDLRWKRVAVIAHMVWMPVCSSALASFLLCQIMSWRASNVSPWILLVLAPPLASAAMMAGISLWIGLMGADYPDAAREWLANIGGSLAMISAVWIVFFAICIFGPWAISCFLETYSKTGFAAIGAWFATTVAGLMAGRSPSVNGASLKGNLLTRLLVSVTPTLFVVGYLLLISFGLHVAIRNVPQWGTVKYTPKKSSARDTEIKISSNSLGQTLEWKTSEKPQATWPEHTLQAMADFDRYFASMEVTYSRFKITSILLALCAAISSILSLRVNINEFSIHHFYKNRLVRCYLGASRGRARQPNARTGFDPRDDFPLTDLAKREYQGPFAIMNTALNLNAGSELATQERKASSFVFTPLYSGWEPGYSDADELANKRDPNNCQRDGYRWTRGYMLKAGPSLGTAMAISGAALSPNDGFHTSGPMAFLLTIFNVRLGWWIGNPRSKLTSPRTGPRFSLKYLLLELTGQTTGRTNYVNLSDGGHFENLGLYELVKRRCRYIIVGDAEEDPDLKFESLGGAIRKCRADFGVEIKINPDPIRLDGNLTSSAHCVIGRIEYPEFEQGWASDLENGGLRPPKLEERAIGWLLYIKASLTGNEPADIAQYHSTHKKFPHEATIEEFYSESQFESYRRLGLHVFREAFADVDHCQTFTHNSLCKLFQELTRKWAAPILVTAEEGARLTDRYSALMRRLVESSQLSADFGGLLLNGPCSSYAGATLSPASYQFGTEVIQFMEDVMNLYGFEQSESFSNPGISGWVEVFRRWARWPDLDQGVWKHAQKDYQHGFRTFFLNLQKIDPEFSLPTT